MAKTKLQPVCGQSRWGLRLVSFFSFQLFLALFSLLVSHCYHQMGRWLLSLIVSQFVFIGAGSIQTAIFMVTKTIFITHNF